MELKDFSTGAEVSWCPGCGNFSILEAFKMAAKEMIDAGNLKLENLVAAAGIGCHAKIMDFLKLNTFYGIHGRVPPAIMGIKLANPNLTVVGFAGDGDAYSEGICHLIDAAKKNADVKMIIHDNQVFALTTGQFTPTTKIGTKTRTSPQGSTEYPLNPIALMLSAGATFVARGFSGDLQHLKGLMKKAMLHKGFAFIDILQPCVTFNNTFADLRAKCYDMNKEGHDSTNFSAAQSKAYETDRIPIGLFYQTIKQTFEEQMATKPVKEIKIAEVLKEDF
jgi:2-oxoglutarate ferredoxin oxidoreductase subunit beta